MAAKIVLRCLNAFNLKFGRTIDSFTPHTLRKCRVRRDRIAASRQCIGHRSETSCGQLIIADGIDRGGGSTQGSSRG